MRKQEGHQAWIVGIVEQGQRDAKVIDRPRIIEVITGDDGSVQVNFVFILKHRGSILDPLVWKRHVHSISQLKFCSNSTRKCDRSQFIINSLFEIGIIIIIQSAPPTTNTNRRRRPDTSNRGTPPSKVANTSNASSKVSFDGYAPPFFSAEQNRLLKHRLNIVFYIHSGIPFL